MSELPNFPAVDADVSGVTRREGAEVTAEDVRAELERICSSPRFQASERRRQFLRFVVGETLAGRAESLKGFTIALAVFGRDESFDPQADPVVRLEARRLRRDLDSYYMDAGQKDAVRISIPKGSYVPTFEWYNAPAAPIEREPSFHETPAQPAGGAKPASPTPGIRAWPIVATIAAMLALGAVLWGLSYVPAHFRSGSPKEPALLVMPFESLSPGESARYLAVGLSQELTSNLFRFPSIRLYTFPPGSNQDKSVAATELGRNLGASYIVNGGVQTDAEQVRVMTTLSNAATGQIVWTRTDTRPSDPQSLIGVQKDLASEIATVIGQPYGIVNRDIASSPSAPNVSNMESYLCVLRGYGYRRSFARAEFEPVLRCLEQTVQRDPEYSDAWAMLGWLHVDAGRLGYTGDGNRQTEYARSLEATSRAVAIQPNNAMALKARASAYFYTGRYAESEDLTRQAAALNPNDPEVLAQLGWRLAVRGNFEEGIPILKRAIERTLSPPGWYFHLIAIDLYLKGDYSQMLRVAERSAMDDPGFSQFLLAVANAELGDRKATRRALDKMSQYEPVGRDPKGFLQRHGATDPLVKTLMVGLEKARALAVMK
ncbi:MULTISPECIES: tetratricopeptide repeat protein [unclassified Bradyrhizobium]|uniref:tetratricopeptide repeat protein n=1 Tax=unclassified Bradyrhizobium TaxID=2631580 RepID=UPI00247ACF80|nr:MULTISPECIES: tetratricopeptide repeat protein [unclassified Bradyrhizobium]WGR69614.1 tetratricopeptide repeat protein [Bradyrhizobium sp. ISRA426]WGR81671.1 tetratricopeptide repeat protein [Bradyrhizobium sp. ISRA430]WGR84855.1 tetratricopeptide repeat protein [Bradyrhizobium sp. ISRA432]